MAIRGVFASDSNIQGARKGDFAASLLQIDPTGKAQLLALTSGMESQDAYDTVITWWEEQHASGRGVVTSTGGVGAGATQVTLVDASFYKGGDILMEETTGEYILVLAAIGNTITMTRGFAGTTAAAIANGSYLQLIGSAYEEGSARPSGVANLGYPRFNYMQIFRNAWDVTGTAKRVQFYTGDVVAKNRADAALFHSEAIERTLWFGKKQISSLNQKPFRTMDGIISMITTNVTTNNATPTVADVQTFVQSIFQKNIRGKPNERLAFCGNTVLGALNLLMLKQSTMFMESGITDWGFKVTRWMTPFGDLSLVTHPLFNESPLWTQNLYVLHPGAMRTRYLRRTAPDNYDMDGDRGGVDADFGVLTTEMSVEYMAEMTAGYWTGITGAGAKI